MYSELRLSELVSITKGKQHSLAVDRFGLHRYIQIDDLRNNDDIKYTNDTKGTFVEERDVVIAWDGANAGTIGYGLKGLIGSTLARLHIHAEEVFPEYLGRFLQSKVSEIRDNCTGATIPHVSKNHLESIPVPIPPLANQKYIARVLEQADQLRKQAQQIEGELKELKRTIFMTTVGPKADDYTNWSEQEISELAKPEKGSMRTGPFGSALKHSEFVDSGIAVIGIDNAVSDRFEWGERRFITEEKYQEMKRYTVFPRDVIITIMGTTGRSAIIPDDIPTAISTKHLASITLDPNKATPEFVKYAIQYHPLIAKQIASQNKGAVMDGLNLGVIKKLKVPVPPLNVQSKFALSMRNLDREQDRVAIQLARLNQLFKALMQRAFNGELTAPERKAA